MQKHRARGGKAAPPRPRAGTLSTGGRAAREQSPRWAGVAIYGTSCEDETACDNIAMLHAMFKARTDEVQAWYKWWRMFHPLWSTVYTFPEAKRL